MRHMAPVLALLAAPAAASLSEAELARAVARPPADAALPAGIAFTDQAGARVTLGGVAAGRPLVLLFAAFSCRHICAPGAAITTAALGNTGLVAGRDYRLAIVGIDPRDGAAQARAFAAPLPPGTAVLRGGSAAIAAAARALGYGYAYDAESGQFAHDAVVYVFGRDARLVALLPEIGLQPAPLRAAIGGEAPAPGLAGRIAHLCYGLGAVQGRYAGAVVAVLRALAVLTVMALGTLAWRRA